MNRSVLYWTERFFNTRLGQGIHFFPPIVELKNRTNSPAVRVGRKRKKERKGCAPATGRFYIRVTPDEKGTENPARIADGKKLVCVA